ncbi:hypothetical protein E2C01_025683 [Portunus trituberculatus]|uniref:Uncharacterized protein n=1 Tax=Portunus trituberculatus TaxID=210409 RepID=A0A5B7EH43_PORTR|nr:hypothetical protein [Portunus trituberculatus]
MITLSREIVGTRETRTWKKSQRCKIQAEEMSYLRGACGEKESVVGVVEVVKQHPELVGSPGRHGRE